jgi:hypothetical protein
MRLRLFATAAVCLLVAAPAFAANQLTNPNFTSDVSGWGTGWVVTWTGAEGASAPGAAQATATASGATGAEALTQCTTAVASGVYDFGAKFKIDPTSSQTGGGRLRVTWYSGAGCSGIGTTDLNWVDPTNVAGWQTLAVSGVTAPSGTVSVLVELIQSVDAAGTFQAFWDDVYFGTTPTAVAIETFDAE